MPTLTALQPATSPFAATATATCLPLLDQSFLFSINGNQEDYAHQLLELNGLACQLNRLLAHEITDQCVQSAIGIVIPQGMTASETYQLGQDIGQQEYQQFIALNPTLVETARQNPLVALADWWTKSYLAHYGQLFLDPRRSADTYISLEVISIQENCLKKEANQPDCAFYAGVIAGFFSQLSGDQYEVIEPECQTTTPHVCKFVLGHAEALNACAFWQTLDQK